MQWCLTRTIRPVEAWAVWLFSDESGASQGPSVPIEDETCKPTDEQADAILRMHGIDPDDDDDETREKEAERRVARAAVAALGMGAAGAAVMAAVYA